MYIEVELMDFFLHSSLMQLLAECEIQIGVCFNVQILIGKRCPVVAHTI